MNLDTQTAGLQLPSGSLSLKYAMEGRILEEQGGELAGITSPPLVRPFTPTPVF